MVTEQDEIEKAVIAAVLAGRFSPGERLVESALAGLYGVSRTRVREALMRLQTRGIVEVSARRGWFIVRPSAEEAHAAYQTRKVIETGLVMSIRDVPKDAIRQLRHHVEEEHAAIHAANVNARVCLLGDFHVHLAELFGNPVLTKIVSDLTARTTLISMLYQPTAKAEESSDDHGLILDALEAGDIARAAALMSEHIDRVEAGIDLSARRDPLADLRDILAPGARARPPRRPQQAAGNFPSSPSNRQTE